MPDSTKNVEEAEATVSNATTDDDLGRLRGILYGDHARQTSDRIDTLEQALLGVIADLREEVTTQFQALESRLASEADTRTSALTNVKGRIDTEIKERNKAMKAVQRDIESTSTDLSASIDHASGQAEAALANARSELSDRVERTENDLRLTGVDRATLADLFERFAQEIKGQ